MNLQSLYGSPIGDPNTHNHKMCPFFVVAGTNGRIESGFHLWTTPGTPMANVMLSFMHTLDFDDMDNFGNSTGPFSFSV